MKWIMEYNVNEVDSTDLLCTAGTLILAAATPEDRQLRRNK
jgi:hypothetical protein